MVDLKVLEAEMIWSSDEVELVSLQSLHNLNRFILRIALDLRKKLLGMMQHSCVATPHVAN